MSYNIVDTILKLFTCEIWIYILSISLQIAGAVCLIINYWGNVEKKVILIYYAGGEIPKAQDNNKVLLKKDRLQSCAKDIYMNRFSFICIIIGYGINLFGNITDGSNKLYILLVISLFCIVFTYTGQKLSSLISKKHIKKIEKLIKKSLKKLQMYNGQIKRKKNS